MLQGFDWRLFDRKAAIVRSVANYRWAAPDRMRQEPLFVPPVGHECEFIIPAMDRHICPTCGRSEISEDAERFGECDLQPADSDRNAATIARRSRSYRDIGDGLTIRADVRTEYSIPTTRAERRRREGQAKKSPFRDKPVLLWSEVVDLSQGGHSRRHLRIPEGGLPGPGILVTMARPLSRSGDGVVKDGTTHM